MISQIWTIGHSTRPIDVFLALLQENGIKAIADVRSLPGSRRHPQFNREALAASLGEHGIAYEHFPELGGRRKAAPDSHNAAWRHPAFRGYADYMETPEFAGGLERLDAYVAKQGLTAMMCAEAVWWQCHRSLISDYLKVRGTSVTHILEAGRTQEHPYTSAAQIVDGQLSYRTLL